MALIQTGVHSNNAAIFRRAYKQLPLQSFLDEHGRNMLPFKAVIKVLIEMRMESLDAHNGYCPWVNNITDCAGPA